MSADAACVDAVGLLKFCMDARMLGDVAVGEAHFMPEGLYILNQRSPPHRTEANPLSRTSCGGCLGKTSTNQIGMMISPCYGSFSRISCRFDLVVS